MGGERMRGPCHYRQGHREIRPKEVGGVGELADSAGRTGRRVFDELGELGGEIDELADASDRTVPRVTDELGDADADPPRTGNVADPFPAGNDNPDRKLSSLVTRATSSSPKLSSNGTPISSLRGPLYMGLYMG